MILMCPPAKVSVRFFHPQIDPSEISATLGIVAKHGWRAGDQRSTPKGTRLPGKRLESYWCGDLAAAPDESLADLLERWVKILRPHAEWLAEVRHSGGRVEFYLALIGTQNAGDSVPSGALAEIGKLGIDLGIEIFSTSQSD